MNIYHFIAVILLFTSIIACKQAASGGEKPSEQIYSDVIPQDFIGFLDKFSRDSLYQLSHIQFPLSGISSSDPSNKTTWQKKDWSLHRPFNDNNGTFQRSFTNLSGIIIEKTVAVGTSFGMERRFSKMADQWTLIYYIEMHDTSGSFQ